MKKISQFLTILFGAFILFACSTPKYELPKNTEHWAQVLDKEANFYNLDNKLFRSEQLLPKDEELIKKHHIKTIINLRFFDRDEDKKAFTNKHLKLVNTPLMSWAISPKNVAEVLWQIEQAQHDGAVLIHCYHGADRTGLIAGVYRIVYQGWDVKEAKREMLEGPYGFHSIWKNIEGFFTQENIDEVKKQLNKLRAKN